MKLLAVLAAALALVLVGCGQADEGGGSMPPPSTAPRGPETPETPETPEKDGLSLALRHTEPLRAGGRVTWTLEVRNGGAEPVTLVFNSGQRGDVVLRRGPTERYRWSRDKAFIQVLGEATLRPGQVETFNLSDDLVVEPGEYQLEAMLTSRPAPPEVRKTVNVVP